MRRPSSPSRLRTSRGLSPHPKALPPRQSVLSRTLKHVQGLLHPHQPSSSQAEFIALVNKQHFDHVALERWFEQRRILDWAHLAHNIIVAAPPSAQKIARTEVHIHACGTSVYQKQVSPDAPVGMPVSDGKGGISHYEKSWTLPTQAVRHFWPLRAMEHAREAAKRLVCLLEVLEADENVFAVLERGDREMLVRWWNCTSSMPLGVKKARLVEKMERLDRKKDQAAKAEEKARRKRLDTAFSDLRKSRKDSFGPLAAYVKDEKGAPAVVLRPLQCERKLAWWDWYGRDPVEVERERIRGLMSQHQSRCPVLPQDFHAFEPF